LLHATIGDTESARRSFAVAPTFLRDSGYTTPLAWCLYDYVRFLQDHGGAEDRHEVLQLQNEALEIAQRAGMKPLMERILRRQRILKA
jgi:hypothetical protein